MSSRSMLVELQADNSAGKFSPGTYCQVQFQLPGDPNLVQVPATALISGDHGTQVAVLGDGDKVVMKPIKIGRDFGDSVEVTAGLTASDRVIDSPPETLQAGDQVQLAATPPAGTQPAAVPSSSKAD
jgi:multidrug efflux pump subunit AcrA (membrane-fusion protein)